MELEAQSALQGVGGKSLPQLVVAGVFGVDAGVHPDPAAVVAVPLFHQAAYFPTLLVGFKVEVLVFIDEPVGGEGDIALDPGLVHGLRGGLGEVIEVRQGGDAEAQSLCDAQLSIFASFCSRASSASVLPRSLRKLRRAVAARWVWQLMKPGIATMPVPSTMVAGCSLGASLPI